MVSDRNLQAAADAVCALDPFPSLDSRGSGTHLLWQDRLPLAPTLPDFAGGSLLDLGMSAEPPTRYCFP